jgi:hypothetical protein
MMQQKLLAEWDAINVFYHKTFATILANLRNQKFQQTLQQPAFIGTLT